MCVCVLGEGRGRHREGYYVCVLGVGQLILNSTTVDNFYY